MLQGEPKRRPLRLEVTKCTRLLHEALNSCSLPNPSPIFQGRAVYAGEAERLRAWGEPKRLLLDADQNRQ